MKLPKIVSISFLFAGILFSANAQKLVSSNLLNNEKPLFIENKGQVADQDGKLRPDVKFIYASGNYKLILKKNGFSHELVRYAISSRYGISKNTGASEAIDKPIDGHLPDKFKEPEPFDVYISRIDL